MFGIKAIASYVPETCLDNVEQGRRFGESKQFITEKIGALSLPVMDVMEETSDLAVKAVLQLWESHADFELSEVDAMIVVTQNGDGEGLPHTSAIVQDKLELSTDIAAFDVSLGCSGFVYGLYILKGFLKSAGLKNGLLITADPYSKVIDRGDRVTSLLFGDAATATWVTSNDPVWGLNKVKFGTDGSGASHLQTQDGKLSMNGRQVFNFAFMRIASHIKAAVEESGFKLDDVDAFCIHQGSASIVDAIARKFDVHAGRFIKDLQTTGNTVSSTIPLLLEKYAFKSDWKIIAISGFGVGLSWASSVLSRR